MAQGPELLGVTVVVAGVFSPPVFHPRWFAEHGLIADNEAEHALSEIVVSPGLTAFTADWLSVQITAEKAILATVDEAQEFALRDAARGLLELFPQTAVDAVGINADAHFRVQSEQDWHAMGDQFTPKDFWEPLFDQEGWRVRTDSDRRVGLRSMAVEVARADGDGFLRVEVAPSARVVPWGIYVGLNSHFQLTQATDVRGTGQRAAEAIQAHWEDTRVQQAALIGKLAP